MSDRLFEPPPYQVEGVTYRNGNDKKDMNGTMSGGPPQVGTVGIGKGLDANRYATKKTVAQGMLDIALLTANASQLKYVLTVGSDHEFYTVMLVLIILSLVLQLMVGLLSLSLSMLRDCRLHLSDYHRSATIISHVNLAATFVIAAVNIIINGFGIVPPTATQILA